MPFTRRAARSLATEGDDARSQHQNQAAIMAQNGVIAPYNRLSHETMGKIFLYCAAHYQNWGLDEISDDGVDLYDLLDIMLWCNCAHVCSRWRQIALRTPALWNRLQVYYRRAKKETRILEMVQELVQRRDTHRFTCAALAALGQATGGAISSLIHLV
jgi:hypothetical protein